jgi:hypothetical protein
MVYPALLPLMRTLWLRVVDWTDAPDDLNGLVLFGERRNLVSARMPSHFKRSLQLYFFFDLGARWEWAVKATPRRFTPGKRPGAHCRGGWVGPRAGLDGCGRSRPPPGFVDPTVQTVTSRYTDWAIQDSYEGKCGSGNTAPLELLHISVNQDLLTNKIHLSGKM